MSNAWKCLPVGEFISQCNWEQITLEISAASSVKRQQSLDNWQCLTAQDFFSLHNWSGQAAIIDGIQQEGSAIPDFSLTLPSQQFWQCFNWSGEKATPTPEKVEQIIKDTEQAIAQVTDFSLNDLSQLF
ncbi:MAG: hypothetical protein AAFO95_19010 [Cyanobacteria bacterium J06600_6]